MLVLAFDTSSSRGSVALMANDRLLAEYTLDSAASYLNRLLAGIDHLMQETGNTIQDVNLIVVSQGPGNFTGLRLGLATAKGLALAIGSPVIAVNTLDALAANFPYASLPVCPVIDAKKNEIYAAFYHCQAAAGQLVGRLSAAPTCGFSGADPRTHPHRSVPVWSAMVPSSRKCSATWRSCRRRNFVISGPASWPVWECSSLPPAGYLTWTS